MFESVLLISATLALATGLIVVIINPGRTVNRSFAIITTLSAAWLFCLFMVMHLGPVALPREYSHVLFWLRTNNAIVSFLPWSFYLTLLAIVEEGSLIRILQRSWLWLSVSCSLAALTFSEWFIPSHSTPLDNKRGIGYTVYLLVIIILCLFAALEAYRQARKCSGIRRLEIRIFLINTCLSALAINIANAAGRIFAIQPLLYAGPFVVLLWISFIILGICHYRIFDARQIFAKFGHNVSTLLILAGCTHTISVMLSPSVGGTLGLLVGTTSAGIVAFIWHSKSRAWLGLDIKRTLAAPRAQIIEYAREEADVVRLITKFEAFLRDWSQAESATFHTPETREAPSTVLKPSDYPHSFPFLHQMGYMTAETLSRRRPDKETNASKALLAERNVGALIAVPRGSHSPSCVVTFGPKHSLRPYTYPDVQILIELVELMDNILTQARVATRTSQIEKMESAAMMSRGLAHDLNNLATPVSTFLLHMEDQVKPGSPEAEVLAHAKHSIRVMQDYIRESLFFARRLVPDFQLLSASDLLAATIKLTQNRAQARGIEVASETVTDASLTADRALILRLLQNLVFNGIDATPRGGRVTLSVAPVDHDHIRFRVADQGPGVPAAIMDHIFEPYFTTKDTGDEIRGLGLGLAICLKISGLHGGEIHVGNTVSGGALFTVSLPLTPKNALDASSSQRESDPIATALDTGPAIKNPAI